MKNLEQSPPPTPQTLPTIVQVKSLRPAIVGQFIAVVLIWSLTPLAAVFTVKEIHWAWGLFLRFSLALVFALPIIYLFKITIPWHKQACISYLAGALGLFGSMTLCYIGAQYVPSALISMIYGFAPILSGLFGILLLKHKAFGLTQYCGLLLATLGMGLALGLGSARVHFNLVGIGFEFSAVLLYVCSALWVSKFSEGIHPIAQMTGATLFSWIGYIVLLPLFKNDIPMWQNLSLSAYGAVIYSALFSSVLAMICYYSLIHNIKTSTLMLITIITPVLATVWGIWLNNELLSTSFFIGLVFTCVGLFIYLSQSQPSST